MRILLLLSCVICEALSAHAAASGPEVSVTGGKIRGAAVTNGGAVFKAIPFAQPPVGDLRWEEPKPVKGWTGVRDASNFAAPCVQGGAQGANSSEDCLYLN